jgi:hypothetical protein
LHQDIVQGIGLVDALVVGQFSIKVLFLAIVKENDTSKQNASYHKKENTIETSKTNHRQYDDESRQSIQGLVSVHPIINPYLLYVPRVKE